MRLVEHDLKKEAVAVEKLQEFGADDDIVAAGDRALPDDGVGWRALCRFGLTGEALVFDLHLVFDLVHADFVFTAPCLQILPSEGNLVDALAGIRHVILAGVDEDAGLRRDPFGLQPLDRRARLAETFGGGPRLGGGLVERRAAEMTLIEQLAAAGKVAPALVGEGDRGPGTRLRFLDLPIEDLLADATELTAAFERDPGASSPAHGPGGRGLRCAR